MTQVHDTAEGRRLATSSEDVAGPWKRWGAYLSERAWGTVREDYSADGDAWSYFTHDHARWRTYRWNEDGMAGISDIRQKLCVALALWNGRDPILKERMFGLTGHEGNHGEDVKECWWYTDATPTHSWLSWRYHYPQCAFPYEQLIAENASRSRLDPEFEILDTDAFADDRYWTVEVDYAKADIDDTCMRIRVTNNGPQTQTIHVLPTVWFRNTWSWASGRPRPTLQVQGNELVTDHDTLEPMRVVVDSAATWLVCDNETNASRLPDAQPPRSPHYPKDGINDHVVHGAASVNPEQVGTKAAAHHVLTVPPGGTAEVRLRLQAATAPVGDLADSFDSVMAARLADADEFYMAITPRAASADEAMVLRQAAAGMVWGQQFYNYNVGRWIDGDPSQPPPPPNRADIRNGHWRHVDAHDVITMPDPWEFPWFASWDVALQTVAIAHLDTAFAKHQLVLLCREWFMHPGGQIPAYEWAFGDVNPPVHAWATLRVFELDGGTDYEFLARVFHKLLINFTWWVNRTDQEGNNVFEGGFLGLDNIGPFNRSETAHFDEVLEQSDATAWMAMYCANMLSIALILAQHDRTYEDVATKFIEHYAYIATAMNEVGMWDEADGFYYDILSSPEGWIEPLRVRSMVGLIPLLATAVIEADVFAALPDFARRVDWFIENEVEFSAAIGHLATNRREPGQPLLLSIVSPERLGRIMSRLCDPDEFLSDHGLRALSRHHEAEPYVFRHGEFESRVDYEPGESSSGLFGGNSNWRGPVWMPVNVLVIEALERFGSYLGDDVTFRHPNNAAGGLHSIAELADDLRLRLVSLFVDNDGRRPVFGDYALPQTDPRWHDLVLFHEYFHGDTGAGLGASHQTGWTGLVIDLIVRRHHERDVAAADGSAEQTG